MGKHISNMRDTKTKHWVPLVVGALVLISVVVGVGTYRVAQVSGVRALLTVLVLVFYLVWCGIEMSVSMRERSRPVAPRDGGTFAYALTQMLVVVFALVLPGAWATPDWFTGVGIALLLQGMALRLNAIAKLGRFYSRRVRLETDHQLIRSGPYRWIRHPAYAGALMGHLGLAVVFHSWVACAIWAGLMAPMVARRIIIEESVLFELNGYAEYARHTRRLAPYIW